MWHIYEKCGKNVAKFSKNLGGIFLKCLKFAKNLFEIFFLYIFPMFSLSLAICYRKIRRAAKNLAKYMSQ
jgi:hypothetical protein